MGTGAGAAYSPAWAESLGARMTVTGRIGSMAIALLLLLSGASLADDHPPPRPKRVLALYDRGKDAPSNVLWDTAVRETLEADAPAVEYYAEFFDASRFTDPAHTAIMHDYLARKYAARPVDVIIAMDITTRFLLGPG